MKKRLIALSTIAALAFGLIAGCGTTKDSSGSTSESSTETTEAADSSDSTYKIAQIHQHMTNSFQNAVADGADAIAKEPGVEITHFDAGQDVATQISQIEQCITNDYDAIIFEPVDPAGLVDAAKAAADAGVICINFSSQIEGWEEIMDGFAGASLIEAGEMEMTKAAELIGGKGQIGILTAPEGDAGGLLRYQGYMNALADYPEIEVAVEAAADWDTTKALETVESWNSSYDLDAIICENDGMAVGTANAVGPDSGIVIIGMDGSEDALEAISNGLMTGTISQDSSKQGELAVQLAYDLLTGKVSGKGNSYTVENVWVDSENVADFQ